MERVCPAMHSPTAQLLVEAHERARRQLYFRLDHLAWLRGDAREACQRTDGSRPIAVRTFDIDLDNLAPMPGAGVAQADRHDPVVVRNRYVFPTRIAQAVTEREHRRLTAAVEPAIANEQAFAVDQSAVVRSGVKHGRIRFGPRE